jgi:hypothetical protein
MRGMRADISRLCADEWALDMKPGDHRRHVWIRTANLSEPAKAARHRVEIIGDHRGENLLHAIRAKPPAGSLQVVARQPIAIKVDAAVAIYLEIEIAVGSNRIVGRRKFHRQMMAGPLRSRRLNNQIRILDRVARANQSDGRRNSVLERVVRLERHRHSFELSAKLLLNFGRVISSEFLGHPCLTDYEVRPNGPQYVEHRGNVIDEGNVDRLDLRPERKAAVGDYEGVRMPNASQQADQVGIQDAGFQHNR